MQLNNILVVIDPTRDHQPAFERGLESARDTGASLHLYACLNAGHGYANLEEAQLKVLPLLDSLALRVTESGYIASSELEWANDWAAQTVAAAARCSGSIIFTNSFDHSAVQREVCPTSD
jgi:hypothetical protein